MEIIGNLVVVSESQCDDKWERTSVASGGYRIWRSDFWRIRSGITHLRDLPRPKFTSMCVVFLTDKTHLTYPQDVSVVGIGEVARKKSSISGSWQAWFLLDLGCHV